MNVKSRSCFDFSQLENLPLCRHYATAYFSTLEAEVRNGTRSEAVVIRWALGWLADGQREVMGVWSARTSRSRCWAHLLTVLKRRGVERISVAVWKKPCCALHDAEHELSDCACRRGRQALSFPILDAQCSGSAKLGLPDSLSPWLCRMVEADSQVGRRFHNQVGRAVRRHGTFESEAAVRVFCASRLQSLHAREQPT